MAKIAGLKLIKSATGKVTHVTLSMKYHAKLLEDMFDHQEIVQARKGEMVPWDEAKKRINRKFKFKD